MAIGNIAKGRKIAGDDKTYEIREAEVSYRPNITPKNGILRLQKTYFSSDILSISMT